ncbi:MAG: HigA family addiction module antidote protein [Chloroflexi bacterium]|nr:HigA family addiction module antidote protein [Chloroflexota bacterium]
MAETFPYVESDAPVSHPGWLLAEELEVRDMSECELARRIGCPSQVISEIVRGRKAITAEVALQLEGEFGTPEYLWLGLQAKYDLDAARRKSEASGGIS